jgi:YbbR domain-containing protein
VSGKISSFVVSLILSFCLWLTLVGEDTTALEVPLQLELTNLPEALIVTSEVPREITCRILANTAQVRFLTDRKLKLPLDVSSSREGYNAFPLTSDSLNLPWGVQVSELSPSLIEFEALRRVEKKLDLEPVIVGTPGPGYQFKSVVLTPDQVVIKGPKELINKINNLYTTPISVENMTHSIFLVTTVALPELDQKLIDFSPKEIQVALEVDAVYTTASFSKLPIKIELKNDGPSPSFFDISPTQVTISVSWPLSRSQSVKAEEIRPRVFIDWASFQQENCLSLPVIVVPPEGVNVTAISPANVTVTYKPEKSGERSKK